MGVVNGWGGVEETGAAGYAGTGWTGDGGGMGAGWKGGGLYGTGAAGGVTGMGAAGVTGGRGAARPDWMEKEINFRSEEIRRLTVAEGLIRDK